MIFAKLRFSSAVVSGRSNSFRTNPRLFVTTVTSLLKHFSLGLDIAGGFLFTCMLACCTSSVPCLLASYSYSGTGLSWYLYRPSLLRVPLDRLGASRRWFVFYGFKTYSFCDDKKSPLGFLLYILFHATPLRDASCRPHRGGPTYDGRRPKCGYDRRRI